jgi:phage shock protein A
MGKDSIGLKQSNSTKKTIERTIEPMVGSSKETREAIKHITKQNKRFKNESSKENTSKSSKRSINGMDSSSNIIEN